MAVVFDFDCTLTTRHMYYFFVSIVEFIKMYPSFNNKQTISIKSELTHIIDNNKYVSKELKDKFVDIFFGGYERVKSIENMLKIIKQKNIKLYISSRGEHKYIKKSLEILNWIQYFSLISSHDGVISLDDTYADYKTNTKIPFFEKYIFPYTRHVLYIDDNRCEFDIMKSNKTAKYNGYEVSCIDSTMLFFINTLKKEHIGITNKEIILIQQIINHLWK